MKLVLTEIYAISIDFMNQSDLQVMVIGKPCCAKGEGQTREGACMTPCTHACQAAVLRHVAEVKEETGYILDSSDTTKVTSACSTQCFNECKCHFMFSESNTWIKFNLQGMLANAAMQLHGSDIWIFVWHWVGRYQAWQEHLICISVQTTLIPLNRTLRFYQICWSSGVC